VGGLDHAAEVGEALDPVAGLAGAVEGGQEDCDQQGDDADDDEEFDEGEASTSRQGTTGWEAHGGVPLMCGAERNGEGRSPKDGRGGASCLTRDPRSLPLSPEVTPAILPLAL
jgi:hypothetical protein